MFEDIVTITAGRGERRRAQRLATRLAAKRDRIVHVHAMTRAGALSSSATALPCRVVDGTVLAVRVRAFVYYRNPLNIVALPVREYGTSAAKG